jgi:hypothetical protein
MSTAHTFDYPANWLLLPSPKGMPGKPAFHPTIETVGFQTAFSVMCLFPKSDQDILSQIEYRNMPCSAIRAEVAVTAGFFSCPFRSRISSSLPPYDWE